MPIVEADVESSRIEQVVFLTNKHPNPDGFFPNTLKNEHIRKSGWNRESPKVSMSLGPKAQASSKTCQPFSLAILIH
uniref:Uncharacterized protein n=1 Tax=Cannabis sativa TaxID=3483 RepID=A0A803QPG3_CANSA